MTTWTKKNEEKLRKYLFRPGYKIPRGLGTKDAACSVAAINLAINGRLSDTIPDCMSEVIGTWIILIQDAMPGFQRNSQAWREALIMAAGTGRRHEALYLGIMMEWMFDTVLPKYREHAERYGFGHLWDLMIELRTVTAARMVVDADQTVGETGGLGYVASHVANVLQCIHEDEKHPLGQNLNAFRHVAAANIADTVKIYPPYAGDKAKSMNAIYFWHQMDPVSLLQKLVAARPDQLVAACPDQKMERELSLAL